MADPKSPPESRRDQRPVDPFPPEVGSWPIYAVLERLEARDWRLAPYVALPILRRLAEAGQLRSRGRCCDETGLPYGAAIEIATAEWIGLEFPPALLLGPHPGTVHDRTARHRTVYAEVELSGADLSQLWRGGAFQQPGWASAATSPSTTHQPGPSVDPPSSSVASSAASPSLAAQKSKRRRWDRSRDDVVAKMRQDGLAKAESMTAEEWAERYNTSVSTARRAYKAFRLQLSKDEPEAEEK